LAAIVFITLNIIADASISIGEAEKQRVFSYSCYWFYINLRC